MFPPVTECPGCVAALPLLREASATLGCPVVIGIDKSSFAQAISRFLDDVRILPLDDCRKPRAERPRGIYGSHRAGNLRDYPRFAAGAAGEVDLILRRSRCGHPAPNRCG